MPRCVVTRRSRGGRLFVGTDGGRLVAVNAATGTVQWSFDASQPVKSSPAVLGDVVVVGCDNGNVYAVATNSGALEGVFKTGGPVLSSPAVAGNSVVVGSYDNRE